LKLGCNAAVAWRIKAQGGEVRLTFDLHRAGGLWLLIFMLMLVVSGIWRTLRDAVFEPMLSALFDIREQRSGQAPDEAGAVDFSNS